jgi:hypothetical protein
MSMPRLLKYLRNMYMGQTAWIVGKGPSLLHLQAEHFGDGPVITMNAAIMPVQALGLPNPLYAMQKDGCSHQPCVCKPRGDELPLVRLAESTTLFLQRPGFSEQCFPMHENAIYIQPEIDLNLPEHAMSIRMCAAIARFMGCSEIVFIACDSLANGDIRRVDFWTGEIKEDAASVNYLPNNPRLLKDLGKFPFRCVTPEGEMA